MSTRNTTQPTADSDKMDYTLPYERGRDSEYVGFNGKTYQIKRGESVSIPRGVYEILYRAQKAQIAADRYAGEQLRKNNG